MGVAQGADTGFLSTLSLRRATSARPETRRRDAISIHALLTESDALPSFLVCGSNNFYPRSPYGERRGYGVGSWPRAIFLSTLSLRRVTLLII